MRESFAGFLIWFGVIGVLVFVIAFACGAQVGIALAIGGGAGLAAGVLMLLAEA